MAEGDFFDDDLYKKLVKELRKYNRKKEVLDKEYDRVYKELADEQNRRDKNG